MTSNTTENNTSISNPFATYASNLGSRFTQVTGMTILNTRYISLCALGVISGLGIAGHLYSRRHQRQNFSIKLSNAINNEQIKVLEKLCQSPLLEEVPLFKIINALLSCKNDKTMSVLLLSIKTKKILHSVLFKKAIENNKTDQIKIFADIIESENLGNCELFALVWKTLKELDHSNTSQEIRDTVIYIGLKLQDSDGNTLLHKAAAENNLKTVQLLIENKANANAFNKKGDTPLHLIARAVSKNQNQIYNEVTKFLINNSADPAQKNSAMEIPYQLAGINYGIKEYLVPGIKTIEERMNLVIEAIKKNNYLETRFLLLPIENIRDQGLMRAAFIHPQIKSEIISLLIKKHAPFIHEKSRTPLMEAIRIGNYSFCLAIMRFQTTEEKTHDDDRNTLYHFTAQRNDPCYLELLDDKKGLNTKNNVGKSPLVIALERNHMKTAKALISLGADRKEAEKFFEDSSVHIIADILRFLNRYED